MATIPSNFDLRACTVPEQKVHDGQQFPLLLRAQKEADDRTADQWFAWVGKNREVLKNLLFKYGAILFRGLPFATPEDFDKFVKAFDYEVFPYIGGAAPRKVISGNVFTTNEAPPDQLIPFHHEMAQVPDPPKVLFFYCQVPPTSGGQTPLVYSPAAYKEMAEQEPAFVRRLEEEGVRYTRVLPDGDDESSPIGRGWQSTFKASTRQEAEDSAKAQGITYQWLDNNCMKTVTKTLPGVRTDERSGKKTWFNSVIAAYLGWEDCRNDRKRAVSFPNGDLMPEAAMTTLEKTMDRLAVDYHWEAGDVCMIDNRQALHGRRSFEPPRRILAALCKE